MVEGNPEGDVEPAVDFQEIFIQPPTLNIFNKFIQREQQESQDTCRKCCRISGSSLVKHKDKSTLDKGQINILGGFLNSFFIILH